MEEIEVKFLNINVEEIEEKLRKLGAQKVFEKLYKRKVFDYSDLRLDKEASWVRLRDEGDKITLAFKQRFGFKDHTGKDNDEGMKEVEVEVSDFKKTAEIILSMGLIEKHYQENKRIRYVLDDIEFDIDFYPQLEPYLEIEADSWDKVDEGIEMLGLNQKDKKIYSTTQIYKIEKGIDTNDYSVMTFEKMIKRS